MPLRLQCNAAWLRSFEDLQGGWRPQRRQTHRCCHHHHHLPPYSHHHSSQGSKGNCELALFVRIVTEFVVTTTTRIARVATRIAQGTGNIFESCGPPPGRGASSAFLVKDTTAYKVGLKGRRLERATRGDYTANCWPGKHFPRHKSIQWGVHWKARRDIKRIGDYIGDLDCKCRHRGCGVSPGVQQGH